MRIWCKLFEKNHMLKDTVMENYDMSMSRTAKVYDCLERACYEFDLEKPMWLDKNKREFISHARTRFYQDNFIEHIDFDYLDFQAIEELNNVYAVSRDTRNYFVRLLDSDLNYNIATDEITRKN